ncbi:hypothetical protein M422DRAFT_257351 [Sphaerobolus stellatus SS14]|uniref:Uncharacterized protein n=1 Tax=Sphaerobolus stellatus (strain SS14) TaxID=990650 RepID=A0A0C9U9K7_SPHS4|nr:hypothetical protein M422DRAFT_257351 [Sphaerobolus stellatus SS14]
MPRTSTRLALKSAVSGKDFSHATREEVEMAIRKVRDDEFRRRTEQARHQKRKLPEEGEVKDFCNEVIEAALHRLRELDTVVHPPASINEDSSAPPSPLPTITVSPSRTRRQQNEDVVMGDGQDGQDGDMGMDVGAMDVCEQGFHVYQLDPPMSSALLLSSMPRNEKPVVAESQRDDSSEARPVDVIHDESSLNTGEIPYISSTSGSEHSFSYEPPSTLSKLSTNDVKVSITGPSTPNNEGTTDTKSLKAGKKSDQARPGPLSQEKLQYLRDKAVEIDKWIEDIARSWGVSTVTITTNMGLDNPQRRGYNFWNIFQSIYWHRILEEHAKQHGDDPNAEKMDQETVQAECHAEYAKVRLDDPDLTDEEMEERKKLREAIKKEYEVLQEEDELKYKEGLTSSLMKKARKEFTMRSKWYAARGVVIGGFAVSIDPYDPTSRTLNFVFVGNEAGRRYFEEEEVNVSALLYEFENYCSIGEIQARKKQGVSVREGLRAALNSKSNDKRKSAISEMLRTMWKEATGTKVTKIPWDEWWRGMVENERRTVGWPVGVPWPSGPKPYSAIDRGKDGRALANAFTAEEGKETRIESWTPEESALAKSLPESMRADNANWLKIPLVVDDAGRPLLTIGEIEDQCKTRSGRNVKPLVKAESPAGYEVVESQQPSNPPVDTNTKTAKQRKAGKGAPAPAPDAKPKSGWTGYGLKRLRHEKEEVVDGRKRPKSRKFIDTSDTEMDGIGNSSANNHSMKANDIPEIKPSISQSNDIPRAPGPRPKPRQVFPKGAASQDPSMHPTSIHKEEISGGDMFGGGAKEVVTALAPEVSMKTRFAGQPAMRNAIVPAPIAGPSQSQPRQATGRGFSRPPSVMGPRPLPRPPRPLPLPTPSFTNLLPAPAVDIPPYVAHAYTPLAAPSLNPLPAPRLDFDTYGDLHSGYEETGHTADTRYNGYDWNL